MKKRLVALASAAMFAAALSGQTSSTELAGVVSAPTGAPSAGGEVTLTRLATGETRHTRSNNEGIYAFPLIERGKYKIVVSVAGLKTTTISDSNLLYQQRARVDARLEIGELTQSVQVMAEARLLNTEDAAVGRKIESKRVVELPVAYRSVEKFALLAPGGCRTRMGITTGTTGRTSATGTAVALVAHGQTDQTDSFTLDGVDIKEPRYNTMTRVPSLYAIAEFKIQTAAYSAEYGLSSGAQVQVVIIDYAGHSKDGLDTLVGHAYAHSAGRREIIVVVSRRFS